MTFTPHYTMQDLVESYSYLGHKKSARNSKTESFIYGINNNVNIIDLRKTAISLCGALQILFNIALSNGTILFVNTKAQSSDIVKKVAQKCNQHYVSSRWLGGTLTNWKTISHSIEIMSHYDKILNQKSTLYTKKEILKFKKKRDKLNKTLEGIKNIRSEVSALFIIDAKFHNIAVREAKKMKIPIISIMDTKPKRKNVDCIIPGNDESRKSINLYCELVSKVIMAGSKLSKYKTDN